MPPSASWNRPILRSNAPVNAPFSCPNSSLSTRLAGIAPQLTRIIGFLERGRGGVDRVGDDFLADPALALDQHRHARARRLGGDRQRGAELAARRRRCPRTRGCAGSFSVSGRSSPAVSAADRGVERGEHPFGPERLDQEIGRAGAHRVDRGGDRIVGGQHQDRQRRTARAELADQRGRCRPAATSCRAGSRRAPCRRACRDARSRPRHRSRRSSASRGARRSRRSAGAAPARRRSASAGAVRCASYVPTVPVRTRRCSGRTGKDRA